MKFNEKPWTRTARQSKIISKTEQPTLNIPYKNIIEKAISSSPVQNFFEQTIKPITKEIGSRIGLKYISQIPFLGSALINPQNISFLASIVFKNPAVIAAAGNTELTQKIIDYFV